MRELSPEPAARGENVGCFKPLFTQEQALSSERAQPRVPWPGERGWAGSLCTGDISPRASPHHSFSTLGRTRGERGSAGEGMRV